MAARENKKNSAAQNNDKPVQLKEIELTEKRNMQETRVNNIQKQINDRRQEDERMNNRGNINDSYGNEGYSMSQRDSEGGGLGQGQGSQGGDSYDDEESADQNWQVSERNKISPRGQ